MLTLILHSWGAPLGEPAAGDIECPHLAYFTRGLPFIDGYGSIFYWRPLSRQLYLELLSPFMLPQPALIAGLHIPFSSTT